MREARGICHVIVNSNFIYMSENLSLTLLSKIAAPLRQISRIPMLLDLISVIAPAVPSNSMGMLHFL